MFVLSYPSKSTDFSGFNSVQDLSYLEENEIRILYIRKYPEGKESTVINWEEIVTQECCLCAEYRVAKL